MENVKVFKEYVNKFNINDKNILLKYYHSVRTSILCEKIAIKMNLSKKDVELAKVLGLLHDIGRFEQVLKFQSFSDKNMDHGDYGADLLFKRREIEKYNVSTEDYKVLEKAIRNHNKYEIEKELENRELLFCQLIRDCDKLEILYRILVEDVVLKEDDSVISDEVQQQFFNEKSVNKKNIHNCSDLVILYLAFIYDFSFKETFVYLKEEKRIEKLYSALKNPKKFDVYFDTIKEFVERKIKEEDYVRKEI